MRGIRLGLAGLAAATLTACASIPLTSLHKLMKLDPETIDPSDLQLAVILPATVRVEPGTAVVEMEMHNTRSGDRAEARYVLDMPMNQLPPELAKRAAKGQTVQRFAVSDSIAEDMMAARDRMFALREVGGDDVDSTLNASVGFCALDPDTAPATVDMTLYVRTRPDQKFFKLLQTQAMTFQGPDGEPRSIASCR